MCMDMTINFSLVPCTSETPSDHQQEHQANTAMSPDGTMNEVGSDIV